MERSIMEKLLLARLKRRNFLLTAGALSGTVLSQQWAESASARVKFSSYPFTLGIASGDPLPHSVVLWTRLAPDPLNGGGVPKKQVKVEYEVAKDASMRNVIRRGATVARSTLGHSVHLDMRGLDAGRDYWYRFKAGGEISPIGHTRTAPLSDRSLDRFTFAFASCQDYQNGFFTAYQNMVKEDLDLVVHLGDYIYEYGPAANAVRQHNGPEIITLEDYRNRYALYRMDPNLQAAHAAFPWTFTWDDHEVDNNYANLIPEDDQSAAAFAARRAAAYQAYYEHMPMRVQGSVQNGSLSLYRRLSFGNLMTFNILDTRQFRTDQPCNDAFGPRCEGSFDEDATMTGRDQEKWLLLGLRRSQTKWNVIAQQTMFAQTNFVNRPFLPRGLFNPDQWDGYVAQRNRITQYLQQQKPSNPVIITGDIHSSWVHDIKTDFDNPESEIVATEFVGPSITSSFGNDEAQISAFVTATLPNNPHTKFFNGLNKGYVRCTITPDVWQTDFRTVSTIESESAEVTTLASFVVEDGQPGAQPA